MNSIQELIGKTVVQADYDQCNEAVLVFNDGSSVLFKSRSGYYGETALDLQDVDIWEDLHRSVKLGLLTKEQAQEHHEKTEKVRLMQQEALERAQFEQLKKKFQ